MVVNTAGKKKHFQLIDHDVQKTVKYGGGHIMVWGSMTYKGVGVLKHLEGTFTGEDYREILVKTVRPICAFAEIDLNDVYYQHDNDPKHTAKATKKWFEDNNIRLLQWPAQSPDLNPIKNLWSEVKRRLKLLKELPKSEDDLYNKLVRVWFNIEEEYCKKLIETMPRRIRSVLKAKGGYTKW